MVKNLKIGMKIYTKEYWSDRIVKAKVTKIYEENEKKTVSLEGLYNVDEDEDTDMIGSFGALIEDIYSTKEEALNAKKEKSRKNILKYKNKLKTIDDIINFCLDTCICGDEYTNYDARIAVIERSKELGIKINTDF